jgi:hypothetical protein
MWGIWCFPTKPPAPFPRSKGDWLREYGPTADDVDEVNKPILVYTNQRDAKHRACRNFGYIDSAGRSDYDKMRRHGWAEVRPVVP